MAYQFLKKDDRLPTDLQKLVLSYILPKRVNKYEGIFLSAGCETNVLNGNLSRWNRPVLHDEHNCDNCNTADIRVVEILMESESEHSTKPNGHVRVPRKIKKYL